jgi:Flp pilus assembly pilin Flp
MKNKRRGATSIEYAAMISLLLLIILGSIIFLSDQVNQLWNDNAKQTEKALQQNGGSD